MDKFLAKFKFNKNDKIIDKIKIILSTIGAAAAAANLLFEFKTPDNKDDKLTKSKNGKVILVNSVAILNLFGSI